MVVVVVKKVVTTTVPIFVVPGWPYSKEVVYAPGLIVDGLWSELVGKTKIHGFILLVPDPASA